MRLPDYNHWKSPAMASLAIFAVVNTVVLGALGNKTLTYALTEQNRIGDDLIYSGRPADIVLLGSSVMRGPFYYCDLRPALSLVYENYNKSLALEKAIDKIDGEQKVYNFARDGEMVSDAMLIVNDFLKDKNKPKVLVYGIAPRDFLDHTLPSETNTEEFNMLANLTDCLRYSNVFAEGGWQWLQVLASKALPYFDARKVVQEKLAQMFNRPQNGAPRPIATKQDPFDATKESSTREDILRPLKKKFVEAVRKDKTLKAEAIASQIRMQKALMDAQNDTEAWRQGLLQYAIRYWYIDKARYNRQMYALEALLAITKQRGIKVMLVNMPLAAGNVSLLPQDFYLTYLDDLQKASTKYGAKFINLQNRKEFDRSCYKDPVHLNVFGGHKLIDLLANNIVELMKN
jgi:hypothetical protein